MREGARARFWIEVALACLSGLLFSITLAWPTWIETAFGIDPDRGSGLLEWLIVAVLLLITVASAVLARSEWQSHRSDDDPVTNAM